MKKNITIFVLVFVISVTCLSSFGQTAPDSFTIRNRSVPYPNLVKLINWLDSSTKNWELEMKQYDYIERKVQNNCPIYTFTEFTDKKLYYITKCQSPSITIVYMDFKTTETVFDELIHEIEQYYIEDELGKSKYVFLIDDMVYYIYIERNYEDGVSSETIQFFKL